MSVDLSLKGKASLCLVEHNISSFPSFFSYESFYNSVISNYESKIGGYAEILFKYGCMQYSQYKEATSPKNKAKDEENDKLYLKWKSLCEQLILLIERSNSANQKIFSSDGEGRNRHEIIDSTDTATNIEQIVILHLKKDLCDFQNKYKHENQDKTTIKEIDLEYLKDALERSRKKEEEEVGISKGREMDVEMLISHMCIQELSFLLRIDALINCKEKMISLQEIKLTNDDFRFIYTFLEYFDLLFYTPPTCTTNTPENIIKDRFKHFHKANIPQKLKETHKTRVDAINKLAFLNKLIKETPKKDKS